MPNRERVKVKEAEEFARVESVEPFRLFPEDLARDKAKLVMTFRFSMAKELRKAACLDGASAIWSMWPGYLEEPSGLKLRKFLEAHSIPLAVVHASGHAHLKDLKRMAEAVNPGRLVPIHSFFPGALRRRIFKCGGARRRRLVDRLKLGWPRPLMSRTYRTSDGLGGTA